MKKPNKLSRKFDGIIQQVQEILNEDEKILQQYSPEFNLIKLSIIEIVGICSILSFFLQLIHLGINDYFFISQGFFIINIILALILLFFCGFLSPILLSKVKLNRSIYIFTNQQVIMNLIGEFHFIPLTNISSLDSIERKNYYLIKIFLKEPMEVGKNPGEIEIRIPIAPKDEEILKKMILNFKI
jgi:hypothetical protein